VNDDLLILGPYEFQSRLFLGTGKYTTSVVMVEALEASGCEAVTVAIRRVDLTDRSEKSFLNHIDRERYRLLPNTAGCYTADDAIRTARLAREAGFGDWIKLEVLGDETTLLPDIGATLEATKTLVAEGFAVLAYTSDDVVSALRLEEAGATSVMPLGSPIGSGQGILNPHNVRLIIEKLSVPVIVDAGVGTASDVSVAMELGADGVLMNTGIAAAKDPVMMARAMRAGLEAGRLAYLAGRMPAKPLAASPSSPSAGRIE
jgi:thiazole synthase